MKLAAIALVTWVSMGSTAHAQVYDVIFGGGNATCRELRDADAFNTDHPNMQWMIGYISGAAFVMQANNVAGTHRSLVPQQLSEGSSEGFLVHRARMLCETSPSRKLWQIANDIVSEYGKRS